MDSGLIALVAVAGTAGVFLAVHLVRRFSVAVLTDASERMGPVALATAVVLGDCPRLLGRFVLSCRWRGRAFVRRRLKALDRLSASAQTRIRIGWLGRQHSRGLLRHSLRRRQSRALSVREEMREKFNLTTVVTASDGPRLRDLDAAGAWT